MGRALHEQWRAFRDPFDRCVSLFERELGRLDKQIADMLRVGEILVGRSEIHAAPTDLAALVRDEMARSALVLARAR